MSRAEKRGEWIYRRNPFVDQVYRFHPTSMVNRKTRDFVVIPLLVRSVGSEMMEKLHRQAMEAVVIPLLVRSVGSSLTPMFCYFPMLDGLIRDLS